MTYYMFLTKKKIIKRLQGCLVVGSVIFVRVLGTFCVASTILDQVVCFTCIAKVSEKF